MKKYIKINPNNDIIDVFYTFQKNKFDGSEIEFSDEPKRTFKINGKSISNDIGVFIFTWDGTKAVSKTKAEIDADPLTIAWLKAEEDKILDLPAKNIVKITDDIIQNIAKSVDLPAEIVSESDARIAQRNSVKNKN